MRWSQVPKWARASNRSELPVGADEAFLHDVFGVLLVARHPEGELKGAAAVAFDERRGRPRRPPAWPARAPRPRRSRPFKALDGRVAGSVRLVEVFGATG